VREVAVIGMPDETLGRNGLSPSFRAADSATLELPDLTEHCP